MCLRIFVQHISEKDLFVNISFPVHIFPACIVSMSVSEGSAQYIVQTRETGTNAIWHDECLSYNRENIVLTLAVKNIIRLIWTYGVLAVFINSVDIVKHVSSVRSQC